MRFSRVKLRLNALIIRELSVNIVLTVSSVLYGTVRNIWGAFALFNMAYWRGHSEPSRARRTSIHVLESPAHPASARESRHPRHTVLPSVWDCQFN